MSAARPRPSSPPAARVQRRLGRASRSAGSGRGTAARSFRGWVTLFVLLAAAALISLGPGTLRELFAGLIFVRPPAASIAAPPSHADAALQARLESVSGLLTRGRLGVVAMDLQSG